MSDEQEGRDFIHEAKQGGWVPKDEFHGNEREWVDAQEFVERGEKINPLLRANNERLKKELEVKDQKHQEELEELRKTATEFKTFLKDSYEKKQSRLQKEIDELKVQRKVALKGQDFETVIEIEEQVEKLEEEKADASPPKAEVKKEEKKEQPEIKLDPRLKDWLEDNKWYGEDAEATDIATAVGVSIRRQFPNLTGVEFLDRLDAKLEERLPEYKKTREHKSPVEGARGGGGGGKGGKKTYDSLPADAKAACDRQIKQKLWKTREEYVEAYYADE